MVGLPVSLGQRISNSTSTYFQFGVDVLPSTHGRRRVCSGILCQESGSVTHDVRQNYGTPITGGEHIRLKIFADDTMSCFERSLGWPDSRLANAVVRHGVIGRSVAKNSRIWITIRKPALGSPIVCDRELIKVAFRIKMVLLLRLLAASPGHNSVAQTTWLHGFILSLLSTSEDHKNKKRSTPCVLQPAFVLTYTAQQCRPLHEETHLGP